MFVCSRCWWGLSPALDQVLSTTAALGTGCLCRVPRAHPHSPADTDPAAATQLDCLGELRFHHHEWSVNENQDGTVEWQALEMKPSLGACSVCLPACRGGQWEGRGQLSSLLRLLCVPAARSLSPGWQEPKASPAVGMEGYQSLDGYF